MTRIIILVLLVFAGFTVSAQQTFTITAANSKFNPALINAKIGDILTFNVGTSHPVLQVEEATYNANGKTALPGGFAFPTGSGTFIAAEAGTVYFVCTNHVSSGMKGKIVISQVTGTHNLAEISEFDIYPNPVDDYLNIKNSVNTNPLSASIFDMAGKKLLQTEIQNNDINKTALSVNNLRKGIYFITVTYTDKKYTRKFIKL